MSMSDDPRYRRGQGGHQRQPASQGRDGRSERPAAPQRGFGQPDTAADRGDGRQPSFSAYRPEAYASPGKGSPRQDWDDGRGGLPRPQSPATDTFPRPAPERPAPHADPRDPYRNAAADPYSPSQHDYNAPSQQDYDPGWRHSFEDTSGFAGNSGSYGGKTYPDTGGNFGNYYEEPPQVNDVQAVHDRFFPPEPEPEADVTHYRGVVERDVMDYGASQYDAGQVNNGYGVQGDAFAASPPPQRAPYPAEQDYAWDNYDQAPPPASLRPYQAPLAGRDDDLDADFFADEDEFENEDYQDERRGGRKKLMAAVLAGAVVTGLGLGFLYKNGSHGTDNGEPATVAADARPVKEAPQTPGGKQFPGSNKLIQDRLGGGGEGDAGTTLTSTEPAGGASQGDMPTIITTTGNGSITTTGNGAGGTLEERIKNALRDAKKPEDAQADGSQADVPHTVRTVQVNPDGSFAGAVDSGTRARRFEAPVAEMTPSSQIVTTGPAEETPPAQQPFARQRVADASAQAVQVTEPAAGGTGDFFVQVGARNVQEDAIKAFAVMQQKYAAVLGNYQPLVRKVDLGEKGIWYRLRVGPFSTREGADKLCGDLKSAGWKQCFSVKD